MRPATSSTAVQKLIRFIQSIPKPAKDPILEPLWEGGFTGHGSVARGGVRWGLIGGMGPTLHDISDSTALTNGYLGGGLIDTSTE